MRLIVIFIFLFISGCTNGYKSREFSKSSDVVMFLNSNIKNSNLAKVVYDSNKKVYVPFYFSCD